MPTFVNTRSGVVRDIVGTAVRRLPDGTEVPLRPGDRIEAGDQVLTTQDSIVEIVQDGPPAAPAAEGELARVIQAVDQGQADTAPAAGVDGGAGGASLAPGLRVDRIAETLGGLGTGPGSVPDGLRFAPQGEAQRAPEDGLASPGDGNTPAPPTLLIDALAPSNDNTPALAGAADAPAGSVVALVVTDAAGAVQTLAATVQAGGRWQVDVPQALADGDFRVDGRVTTPAGLSASDQAVGSVDTRPPVLTLALDPIAGDDLLLEAEAGAPVTLGGRAGGEAQPGDLVTVSVGGQALTAAVQADGRFAVAVPGALLAGAAPAEVIAGLVRSDAVGNVGSATAVRPYAVDRAPVAVADAAALGEDGPAAAGDLTPGTTGQDRDPEGGAVTVVAVGTAAPGAPVAGLWGLLVVQPDGAYTYAPSATAQALRAGETATDRFGYRIADAAGNTAEATLSVTLTGANDAAAFGGTLSGRVGEDGLVAVAGRVEVADTDAGESQLVPQAATAGTWGRFAIDAQGQWTYVLDNAGAAVQGLAAGQQVSESFAVQSVDGTVAVVTVTIDGRDDPPVISRATASVVEDIQPVAGGTLTASDADNPGLAFVAGTQPGAWGSLLVGADGGWRFELGPQSQALGEGERHVETFTVGLTDGSTTTVTIDVAGRDDVAQIGNGSGSVIEDEQPAAAGTLPASDIDNPALAFVPAVQDGTWGSLTVDAAGAWSYRLGPQAQALAGGQVEGERFVIGLTDGSTTTVSIVVTGTDDAPVVSAGSGSVTEDLAATATGTLTATDADDPGLAFLPATLEGRWGTLVLEASGAWRYALGPQAQALTAGQPEGEAFQVFLSDGSSTTVTIAITGQADPLGLDLDADDSSGAGGAAFAGSFAPRGGPVAVADADLAIAQVDAGPLVGATLRLANAQAGDVLVAGALPDGLSASVAGDTLTITGSASAAAYAEALRGVRFDNAGEAPEATTRRIEITVDNGSVRSNVAVTTLDVVADAVNDAPVNALPAALSVAEDQPLAVTGLSVSDPDAADGRDGFQLATVRLAVGQGTLQLTLADGASLVAGQNGGATLTLAGDQDALGATLASLVYQGRAGYSGSDALTVTSTDGLGLSDTDTVAITVRPVNDAPSGADRTIVLSEDGSVVLGLEDFGFADAPGETDALASVRLLPPSAGTLSLDGVVLTGPVELSRAQIESGGLRFAPAPDASGDPYATLSFQVRDDGGVADGGVDTDPTPRLLRFEVRPVDDRPVVSEGRGSVVEDSAPAADGTLTASDADDPGLAFVAGTRDGAWGTLSIDAGGAWRYALGPAAQALAGGQVETETFEILLTDGTTTTVTVTVTGTDDAPVVSAGTGAVTEDLAPGAAGTLEASDADNPGLAFVPAVLAGDWGELVLEAGGAWVYTLGAAAQALAPGQAETEIFTVLLNDGTTTTVTLTVTGNDDDPVVSAGTGTVTEDNAPSTGGRLTASDIDNPGLAFVPGVQTGDWGELTVSADGQWSYTLGPVAQALAAGQIETEIFNVTLTDNSITTVTITVTGTDDLPVISAGTGSVTEDTSPSAAGQLTASDVDNPALAFEPGVQAGNWGQLSVDATGQWSYTLGAAAQALAAGQLETEVFTVRLTDDSTTTVTITVRGTDDLPVISADTGSVTEDTAPATAGQLTASDVDNPALAFVPGVQAGAWGQLTVSADGLWSYTLGAAAQALAGGQIETETFTVSLTDNSTTTVTITVTGTDDLPVISADTGSVTEDTSPTTAGQLTASDVDNPGLAFVPGVQAGDWGQLTVDATGQWSYALGPNSQALANGQVETERFEIALSDGTTTTVSITVTGTDDLPVISADTGSVTEDTAPSTGGQLTASDVDNPGLAFVPGVQTGDWGQLAIDATGQWSYTLGVAAQTLPAGQIETEVFTVGLSDNSTTTVTITITGTDDLPVISTGTGSVTEDTSPTTAGQLTASDVDNASLAFVPGVQAGDWGQLSIDATGQWSYTLGAAAQALAAGQIETEVFTVGLSDNSTTTVTITITGTDDLPVISTGTGSVTEDITPTTAGQLTASDVDDPALAFVPGVQAGDWGQLSIDATGQWTYTLGAAAQALADGQTETEVFTVTLTDHSTTTVTVTVTGTNDLPQLDLDGNDSSGAGGGGYRTRFTGGGTPVAIADVDAAVSDIDSPTLSGATVTLQGAQAGDTLLVGALPPGITAVVAGNVVQLVGAASAAAYATALQAVSFGNGLAAPVTGDRTVDVTVTDGSGRSNTATATITVAPDTVNDTPVNTVPGPQVLLEDQRTPIAGVAVADPDVANPDPAFRIASAELSVSNGTLHALLASGASVVAGALGSGRFTLSGTQDAINATLATLAYQGRADYVGGDTLVLITRDGLGLTDADTVQIRVDPVNDAPSGADRTLTVGEDQTLTLRRGDFSFQDAPGEGNGWVSLTVTAPDAGTLRLGGQAITGPTVVLVSDLDNGRLGFVPAPDANGPGYARFTYAVKDDGGTANGGSDTDPTPNTVTIDVTPADDPVTVIDAAAQVSEEGLVGGMPDGTGTPDTTNAAVASGRLTISDVDGEPIAVTLLAPVQALSSRGEAVAWSGGGSQALTATAGGRTIATATVDDLGNYRFSLLGPIDHPGQDVEDSLRIDIGVRATSGGRSDDGVLAIAVEDDGPVPSPVSLVVSAAKLDTNLMIVLDTSGSMLTRDGVDGATRLESARQAILQLLDRYAEYGNVAVRLVTFSSGSASVGSVWTDVATAKAQLNNLSATGGTNYDAALAEARTAFDAVGKLATGQNALYFFTDGQPVPSSNGINASEERSWVSFLDSNLIKAFGIGLGVDAAKKPIDPVAHDGQITENLDALLVSDFAQLDQVLAATVPTSVTSPLLAGGRFDNPASGIGADGGFVRQMQFGSTVYTYDPANGGSVGVTGGPDRGVFDTTTNTLTVTTGIGGRFAIDLDNGEYTYTPPLRITADTSDGFDFIATDRDGDSVASRVQVTVDLVEPRRLTAAADNATGSAAADAISGLEGNDSIAGAGGDDRLAGNAGNDTLRGDAGADQLFGGSGTDTLDGGDGNDLLDGGAGGDQLTGGAGADVFAWTLYDRGTGGAPAIDTLRDFDGRSRNDGGDVLDLRDLLVGETPATLDRYLDFLVGGGNTAVRISSTGGFTGGSYLATAEDQRLTLQGVDIRAALGLDGTASDALILQTLLDRSKLLVDAGP